MDITLRTKYDIGESVITYIDNRLFVCKIEGIEIHKSISIETGTPQHSQNVAYKVRLFQTQRFFIKTEQELFTKEDVNVWLSSLTSKNGE